MGARSTEALSYAVQMDTVNPPIKQYPVPAANVAAAVAGVVSVTFAELGFTPLKGTDYFTSATATDADGTSAPTAILAFAYNVVPNAPTGFKVG